MPNWQRATAQQPQAGDGRSAGGSDASRLMVQLPQAADRRIRANLDVLYGADAGAARKALLAALEHHLQQRDAATAGVRLPDVADCALITYADTIVGGQGAPLRSLGDFGARYLRGIVNTVHVLPFYPWDTDRGFSITDYTEVDPRNGSWEDFAALSEVFAHRMVDLVVNHASLDNPLVQGALTGDERYAQFVITYDDDSRPTDDDLSKLARPRPHPVLTEYFVVEQGGRRRAVFDSPGADATVVRRGWVWTTFSRADNADGTVATRQVDLNFRNPRVLVEMLSMLLDYCAHGADWVRLDAIGYMWKELGTSSLHHDNTHRALQVLRDALSVVPPVLTIAEVNEPQDAVIPYLGPADEPESDLVYQFAHFPLAVQALLSGDGHHYGRWIDTLRPLAGRQFITILGSHDGMGRKPAIGLLPDAELQAMVDRLVDEHGALPNHSRLPGGEQIVYELCATPWNLINRAGVDEPLALQIDRYVACVALGLPLRGVPALYINGLLGMPNRLDPERLDENRTINRERFEEPALFAELDDEQSQIRQVLERILRLLEVRAGQAAFAPDAPPLEVLPMPAAVVGVVARAAGAAESVVALTNCSGTRQAVSVAAGVVGGGSPARDLIAGTTLPAAPAGAYELTLAPYQVVWLRAVAGPAGASG